MRWRNPGDYTTVPRAEKDKYPAISSRFVEDGSYFKLKKMCIRDRVCSFFNLQAIGAKHSGDIRSIPNKKGTAEYIELDLNELNRVGAEYKSSL